MVKIKSKSKTGEGFRAMLPVLIILAAFVGAAWVYQIKARQAGISVFLIAAIERNDAREAAQALAHGADPDAAEAGNYTCLMHETEHGNAEIVRLLLAHGADVTQRDKAGKTALMYAKERRRTEIARLLQEAGARD